MRFGYISRKHETTIQLFRLLVGLHFKMLRLLLLTDVTRPKSNPNDQHGCQTWQSFPNDLPGYELKVLTYLINVCNNLQYITLRNIIGGYSLTVAQIVTVLPVDIDTPKKKAVWLRETRL